MIQAPIKGGLLSNGGARIPVASTGGGAPLGGSIGGGSGSPLRVAMEERERGCAQVLELCELALAWNFNFMQINP